MPWTPKQMKVIRARAHGWKKGEAFKGVSVGKAKEMETEGLRPPVKGKRKKRASLKGQMGAF